MTTLTKGLPSSIILLKGGTVLTHSPTDDKVIPLHDTDVLVLDNIIAQVGKDISPPVNDATTDAQVEIIDCKGKIVSPGFIDTHHHLWQTQLKGRHAEEGLVAYMVSATSALNATLDSGIRAVIAYTIPLRISRWDKSQCVPSQDLLPEWPITQLGDWAERFNRPAPGPATDPIVEVGMGFDFWFLPKGKVLGMFRYLRSRGLRLVTTHVGRNAYMGLQSAISKFQDYFLVLSHCNGLSEEDYSLLASSGTAISSTPDTEAQMGMSYPIGLHPRLKAEEYIANVSLGADCHSNNPSSIPLQARALLQLTRVEKNAHIVAEDNFPSLNVTGTSDEVFNLATIRGARCLGVGREIGSLEVGKKADLVFFDTRGSVGMLAAAEYNPVVAVVRFSEAADIECVIVDGKVRKNADRLVRTGVSGEEGVKGVKVSEKGRAKRDMEWKEIAEQGRRSRKEVQERIDGLSLQKGREAMLSAYHTDVRRLVGAE